MCSLSFAQCVRTFFKKGLLMKSTKVYPGICPLEKRSISYEVWVSWRTMTSTRSLKAIFDKKSHLSSEIPSMFNWQTVKFSQTVKTLTQLRKLTKLNEDREDLEDLDRSSKRRHFLGCVTLPITDQNHRDSVTDIRLSTCQRQLVMIHIFTRLVPIYTNRIFNHD